MNELEYGLRTPVGARDGVPVLVLLHGRGSNRADLELIAPFLPDEAIVVTPQAPFPGARWGYGGGWAWYRYLGDGRPEEESFLEAQRLLGEFLAGLPERLPVAAGRLVLGGFSQGGVMSLGHALMHPGVVPAAVNLSGFLPRHVSVRVSPQAVGGTRFFWGHGTRDEVVPFDLALEGRQALRDAGASLAAHDYPMGHTIAPSELRDLTAWLREGDDHASRPTRSSGPATAEEG